MQCTAVLWLVSCLMSLPLNTLHIPIVESEDPVTKYSPSGENATLLTKFE